MDDKEFAEFLTRMKTIREAIDLALEKTSAPAEVQASGRTSG